MTSRQSCDGEVAVAVGAGLADGVDVPVAAPVVVVDVVAVGVAVVTDVAPVLVPDTVVADRGWVTETVVCAAEVAVP